MRSWQRLYSVGLAALAVLLLIVAIVLGFSTTMALWWSLTAAVVSSFALSASSVAPATSSLGGGQRMSRGTLTRLTFVGVAGAALVVGIIAFITAVNLLASIAFAAIVVVCLLTVVFELRELPAVSPGKDRS